MSLFCYNSTTYHNQLIRQLNTHLNIEHLVTYLVLVIKQHALERGHPATPFPRGQLATDPAKHDTFMIILRNIQTNCRNQTQQKLYSRGYTIYD